MIQTAQAAQRAPLHLHEIQCLVAAIGRANTESEAMREARWRAYLNDHAPDCPPFDVGRHAPPNFQRAWWVRESKKYPLHLSVLEACKIARPHNWHLLVLEWPHVPEAGIADRVAYTQSDAKGNADRQTVTGLGKYLARHWKGLIPDNLLRDIALRAGDTGCRISRSADDILEAVLTGPSSCMKWASSTVERAGGHPYQAYAPKFGWGICTRRNEAGVIIGRALVYESEGEKGFVRTYGADTESGYSHADETMAAWLRAEGYTHWSAWPEGAKLAKVRSAWGNQDYMLPYIDGNVQAVDEEHDCFVIYEDGAYSCDNTDGSYDHQYEECDDCGSDTPPHDMCHIGLRRSARCVCRDCADEYTYVRGAGRAWYYVDNDHVVEVGGDCFDGSFLSDNDIVQLSDGDHRHIDDAFCCAVDDEWYEAGEGIYVEDLQDAVHESNAWQCTATGKWYSTEVDPVIVDGDEYHPDDAPEEEEEQGDSECTTS